MEWINPQHADMMKRLRQAQQERQRRGDDRPVRGFVMPSPSDAR
jgi:hypothetical protein